MRLRCQEEEEEDESFHEAWAAAYNNPSFVQAWACLKLVSRAKQSLPVISLEIPVRPSVVDKNQTLGNLAQVQPKKARTRKPLPMPKRWLNNKQSNPWKIGHEWKPKSSQQQRSAIIVKKQEEANIEESEVRTDRIGNSYIVGVGEETNNASGTLKLKKRSKRRVYW